jgi:hypothetical protein
MQFANHRTLFQNINDHCASPEDLWIEFLLLRTISSHGRDKRSWTDVLGKNESLA